MNKLIKIFFDFFTNRRRQPHIRDMAIPEPINVSYSTIKGLRNRLIEFQLEADTKTFQEHRQHFDDLAQDFIDLDVPQHYVQQITQTLAVANKCLELLTPDDFIDIQNDSFKRNQVYGVLSQVARELSKILVGLQKELGFQ